MLRYAPLLFLVACTGAASDTPQPTPQPSPQPSEVEPPPVAPAPQVDPSEPTTYQTHLHEGGGVAFELGKGWQISGEESSTLLAASPEGQVVLMFHIAEPEALEAALKAIRRTLAAEVKDIYLGPNKERKLGELTVEYASGAGKLEGRPVELGQLLVATPTGKVLVVVAVIEATAPGRSKKEARHTLESIRPQKSM